MDDGGQGLLPSLVHGPSTGGIGDRATQGQ